MAKLEQIIQGMRPWYTASSGIVSHGDMRAADNRNRTAEQIAWDRAILTAAEFVRRLDNYDETRALAIHGLLSTHLPKDEPA